jgi:hypothetical protein
MTPAEAAHYMGIPNCIMVVFNDLPRPPFHQHALALSSLQRVVWSIVGDASSTRNDEESDLAEVLRLAQRHPNVTGAIMDDFFHRGQARYPLDEMAQLSRRLHSAPRPLELWVVLYYDQVDRALASYLDLCDVVTFWTMPGSLLVHLEQNFQKLLALTPPAARRVLGCYMWNYGEKRPMSVDQMRHQCELGLTWLREGHIEGMIFLASCICDLDLEAVEWTRAWIAEVGNQPLARSREHGL